MLDPQAADQSKRIDPAGIDDDRQGMFVSRNIFIDQFIPIIFTTLYNKTINKVRILPGSIFRSRSNFFPR